MGWYILLGTIPIGIFGLAFKDQIENGARDLYLIGVMLIALGLVLLAAEQVGKRTRKIEDLNARDGAVIGFAQAVALIPGLLALGVHDHRGAVPRASTARPRRASRSCCRFPRWS